MRTTHTFVLRLWMDTDEPNEWRGTLHSVANDADYPFTDMQMLLDLLQQLTSYTNTSAQADQPTEGRDE
jgi:hypothetical protein